MCGGGGGSIYEQSRAMKKVLTLSAAMEACWHESNVLLDFLKDVRKRDVCEQWRSQNAEKVTHIKVRLLDQAVILFNCVPFQNWNFS